VEGERAARCGRLVLLLRGACSLDSFVGVAWFVFTFQGFWMDGSLRSFGVYSLHLVF
jgi:hypothetical protein